MPSFDIVSEVDTHELQNAVDQANREVDNRFDFKNTNAKFAMTDENITLTAPTDFHVQQMAQILDSKIAKRQINVKALSYGEIATNLHEAKQVVKVQQGISQDDAKAIIRLIKDAKLKVQGSIQGEQVRVTGKNRDDLQEAIALLREKVSNIPIQFNNFRD